MLSVKERLHEEEFQNTSKKGLAIDTEVRINIIKPKTFENKMEFSHMFRAESNFIHRQNNNTMGNMEIDQLINLVSTVCNHNDVNTFDCNNFLAYKLKGDPHQKSEYKEIKERKMKELRNYRRCIVKQSAVYLVENNNVLQEQRKAKTLLNAANLVVDDNTKDNTTTKVKKNKNNLLQPTIPYLLENVCMGKSRLRQMGLDRKSYAIYMFNMFALFDKNIYSSIQHHVKNLSNKVYHQKQQKNGDYTFTYRHQASVTNTTSGENFEQNDLGK